MAHARCSEERVLADTHAAMDLDAPVEYRQHSTGNNHLDHGDFLARAPSSHSVDQVRGVEHEQPCLLELHPALRQVRLHRTLQGGPRMGWRQRSLVRVLNI